MNHFLSLVCTKKRKRSIQQPPSTRDTACELIQLPAALLVLTNERALNHGERTQKRYPTDKADSPAPEDMKRRSDSHHHPRTQPITHPFSHFPALSMPPAAQLSTGTIFPHTQRSSSSSSSRVAARRCERCLRGLFAKHPSWTPGVHGA